MRSATLVSLLEYGEFLGIDPYLLAQVDYTGGNVDRLKDSWCEVFVEYAWQKKPDPNSGKPMDFLSRESLVRALTRAEHLFYQWTRRYPAPTNVINEAHPYSPPIYNTTAMDYVFQPTATGVTDVGVWTLTLAEADVVLDRSNLDLFTATFTVPDGTSVDDIHVYLTATDGSYSGDPQLQHEIRPVQITVDGEDATLTAPAYLFVLPSLYAPIEPTRLAHNTATYVTKVDIYIRSVDPCQHGTFVFPETDLSLLPESTRALYLTLEKMAHNEYVKPHAIECDDTSTLTRYGLPKRPKGFRINYVAGYPLVKGRVDEAIKVIVCKLATALLDFDFSDTGWERRYGCSGLFIPRVRDYQDVPATRTTDPRVLQGGATTGATFQTLVPTHLINRLNGRVSKGIVEAYDHCINLEIVRF